MNLKIVSKIITDGHKFYVFVARALKIHMYILIYMCYRLNI